MIAVSTNKIADHEKIIKDQDGLNMKKMAEPEDMEELWNHYGVITVMTIICIDMGIFYDPYCFQYAGNEVNLKKMTGLNFMKNIFSFTYDTRFKSYYQYLHLYNQDSMGFSIQSILHSHYGS